MVPYDFMMTNNLLLHHKKEGMMEQDLRQKGGYVAYALASIVLAILASALPFGPARTVCWIALLPFVLGFSYITRRLGVVMGGRKLVIAYAILFGFFWLLLGASALEVQIPLDQLYAVWAILFIVLVCAQAATQRTR